MNSRPVSKIEIGSTIAVLVLLLAAIVGFETTFEARGAAASAAGALEARAPATVFADVPLTAKAAYVLDVRTGKTLFAKNADAQLPLASLTKVALALVVAETLPLDASITIPRDTAPPKSAMRLGAGEHWKVQDVLDFTLVASSNGGALALAEAADARIGISKGTLTRMNAFAREIGLTQTYFLNVHGLDESTTQAGAYGSARDMAHMLAYAASHAPEVFANTARDALSLAGQDAATSAFNTNEALPYIPGLILGKTGFTDLAGGNLGVVFDAGLARPIAIVVLGSTHEGRFEDMRRLVRATLKALDEEALQ